VKSSYKLNSFLLAIFIVLAGFIAACEGPEGPAGKDGVNGKDGKDGANGTAVCGTCHNETTQLVAKMSQWELSKHGEGVAFMDANRGACAACHTSEGYLETAKTGADTTVTNGFANPSTINCRTCHKVHQNYDATDWAFTSVGTFTFRYGGHKEQFDFKNANLCSRCHQARVLNPAVDETKDSMSITSFRWGPHYGNQSNVLAGQGLFSFDGTALPSVQAHQNINNSCFKCHMAGPSGAMVGGHSFMTSAVNEETGAKTTNAAGCLGAGCHTSVDAKWNPDKGTKATDIWNDLLAVRENLITKKWLDTANSHGNPGHEYVLCSTSKPLKLTKMEAKILANYIFIVKDKSMGMHNPKYVGAALKELKKALGL
jgi:hypothetical protein